MYNYIEAVKVLPTNFSPAEVETVLKRINNPKLVGRMRSTFIVLSDDDYRKKLSKHAKGTKPVAVAPPDVSLNSSGSNSSTSSGSGSGSGSGSKSGHSKSRHLKRGADATSDTNPSKARK